MYLKTILLATLLLCNYANGAKILCVYNFPSYSHYILGERLLEELASKGHEVTMVSPYKNEINITNYRNVHLDGMKEYFEGMQQSTNLLELRNVPLPMLLVTFNEMMLEFSKVTLDHPKIQKLLKEDNKYDVIILEQFMNEALKGLCHHYKAPCIALASFGSNRLNNHLVGNPTFPSYMPDLEMDYSRKMTFAQRLINSLLYVFQYMLNELIYYPKHNALMQNYFPNAPPLQELMTNTALIFLISHPSINQPVPHTPNTIEIGGMHVKPAKKLPDDLKRFLDGSSDGAIFFSLGSNVKSKDLPTDKIAAILKAFSKLKQKVLWKFEDDTLDGLSKNVMIAKWLPQQSILAHPNVKLFITHGGLLSLIESVHYGVPMVGIPIFAEQSYNMQENVLNGIAVTVELEDLNEHTLLEAINKVLYNKSYLENVRSRSAKLRDQPLKPLDAAVYWTEYVIRHKGATHLRSASLDLAWYQYLLLDVALVVVLVTIVGIAIFIKCFIIAINLIRRSKNKKEKTKQKKSQ